MPCGIGEEASGPWTMTLGSASKTRDGMVEALKAWWAAWEETEQVAMARLQITRENGPESRGRRTPFVQRMGALCAAIGQPIQRRYSPPDQSTDNPIARCWGLLALHGHGTKLVEVETMVAWAKRMTWKGIRPIVALSRKADQKGGALRQRAMQAVEARLARHSEVPKGDMLIHPASTSCLALHQQSGQKSDPRVNKDFPVSFWPSFETRKPHVCHKKHRHGTLLVQSYPDSGYSF
jgi:Rhodopirellula transposase DDE domain